VVSRSRPVRREAGPSWHTLDHRLTSALLERLLHHAEAVIIEGKKSLLEDQIETP
jgi:hypothetical protein